MLYTDDTALRAESTEKVAKKKQKSEGGCWKNTVA